MGALAGALAAPARARRGAQPDARHRRAGLGGAADRDRRRARRRRRRADDAAARQRGRQASPPSSARSASPPTACSARRRGARCGTSRPRTGSRSTASSGRSPPARSGSASPATSRTVASASSTTVALQRALGIAADGVYGPMTREAVRRFQASPRARGRRRRRARPRSARSGISGPHGRRRRSAGSAGSRRSPPRAPSSASRTRSAATGDGGWDCSGLVQWAMAQAGVTLPRTSYDQFGVGTPVDRASIQAGDLVFFNADGPGASHVGDRDQQRDRDLGHHPRRHRARDRRRLLGRALRRRAPHVIEGDARRAVRGRGRRSGGCAGRARRPASR